MPIVVQRVLTTVMLLVAAHSASAGRFEFVPDSAAGAAGTVAAPDLVVRFTGDNSTVDSQADFEFAADRMSVSLTGIAGAMCTVIHGNRIRVLAPLRLTPFPQTPIEFCRVRVTLLAGATLGITPIAPVPGSAVCVDSDAELTPCSSTGGTVSIGAAAGTASLSYLPAPGTAISIAGGGSNIDVTFNPGGAGDSIVVSGCAIAGDSVFEPVVTEPAPLTFAGAQTDAGGIGLRCQVPSAGGIGQLTCAQSINGQPPVMRSWNVNCPNSFVAPAASYSPTAGSPVNVVSVNVLGEIERATISASIATDGLGSGLLATTTISNCAASNDFVTIVEGGSLTAAGAQGATGTIAVSCVADVQAQSGLLSCDETRAGALSVRTWNLTCPAGRPPEVFTNGFD
jgi:hypothetical protein